MAQKSKLTSTLSGVAGEYFVAAELSRRGCIATLTLKNTKGVDILASNSDATYAVAIQVKAVQSRSKKWVLKKSVEEQEVNNLFYIFVRLNDMESPAYHIVPCKVVGEFAKQHHYEYITTPGKRVAKRKDGNMRKFIDTDNKYLNRWDLLKIGARLD